MGNIMGIEKCDPSPSISKDFEYINGNKHRAIYVYHMPVDNNRTFDYLAKVTPQNTQDDEMYDDYEKTGPTIESMVYHTITSKHICPLIYACDETNVFKHTIHIRNKEIFLDFSEWRDEYASSCDTFSIIVVRKYRTYHIIDDNINVYSSQDLEQIFIHTMKCIHVLNLKYEFVHGDLKTDNIVVNKHKDVKIIDFDGSKLGKYYSENIAHFDNGEILTDISLQDGFLFDFYRLYSSIYIWDDTNLFRKSDITLINDINYILDKHILNTTDSTNDQKNNIFNNAEYFNEWKLRVTYDQVIHFIYMTGL